MQRRPRVFKYMRAKFETKEFSEGGRKVVRRTKKGWGNKKRGMERRLPGQTSGGRNKKQTPKKRGKSHGIKDQTMEHGFSDGD